jgi:hypothetical protein
MRIVIAKKSVGGSSPRSQLRAKIVQKNEASAQVRSTCVLEDSVEWPEGWTKKIHSKQILDVPMLCQG